MLLQSYCIYDRKGLVYHAPFFALQDGQAVRSFTDLCNDPGTTIGRHPHDYALYRCGAYDDASGQLLPASVLELLADGTASVRDQGNLFADLSASAAPVIGYPSKTAKKG